MPGNAFAILHYSITPVLLWLRAMVIYGGKLKPGTPYGLEAELGFFA